MPYIKSLSVPKLSFDFFSTDQKPQDQDGKDSLADESPLVDEIHLINSSVRPRTLGQDKMPSRTLPTFTQSDLELHATSKSCYVTIGSKVFDITPFLDDHPGGGDLIVQYGSKDISAIMRDEISHSHSEAAYEVLEDHLVGFISSEEMGIKTRSGHPDGTKQLPASADETQESKGNSTEKLVYATTGMSSADDLSKETDSSSDFRTHKFLDLKRPLLMQIWNGGFSKDFYLEQVHRPRHYKGGASAPLFGNFLEPLSKTPWWVVPLVWLPPVMYGTYISRAGLSSWTHVFSFWMTGLFLWTLVEYTLHRGLFHMDKYVLNPVRSEPRAGPIK